MRESIACRFANGGFFPTDRFVALAQEKFADGAAYWLSIEPDRSDKTHNHEFAVVHEAWKQLPDHIADQFPTSDHLRKRALVDAGFYTEQIIDAGTSAAALRVAAHLRRKDDFAVVVVRGPIVVERTAKSQNKRAMGAGDFQKSKQAVLEIVAGLIGVSVESLTANTGADA